MTMPLKKIAAHTEYEKKFDLTLNVSGYCQLTKTKISDYQNRLEIENKALSTKTQKPKKLNANTFFATPISAETAKPVEKLIANTNPISITTAPATPVINEDDAEYDFCDDVEQQPEQQEIQINLIEKTNYFKA